MSSKHIQGAATQTAALYRALQGIIHQDEVDRRDTLSSVRSASPSGIKAFMVFMGPSAPDPGRSLPLPASGGARQGRPHRLGRGCLLPFPIQRVAMVPSAKWPRAARSPELRWSLHLGCAPLLHLSMGGGPAAARPERAAGSSGPASAGITPLRAVADCQAIPGSATAA